MYENKLSLNTSCMLQIKTCLYIYITCTYAVYIYMYLQVFTEYLLCAYTVLGMWQNTA